MTIHVHRFVVLDVMRTIAALAVVTVHTGHIFPGAAASASGISSPQLAVDFFFLLSGFVLAAAYEDQFDKIGLWEFLKLRLIRLYPLYLFSVVINLYGLLKHASHQPPVYFINLGFALAFLPSPFDKALYPFGAFVWTLFFELLANMIFAWLKKPPALTLGIISALFGALMILGTATGSLGFIYGGVNGGHTWVSFMAGLIRVGFSFFAGVLLYRFWRTNRPSFALPPALPLAALAIALFVKVSPSWRVFADLVTVMLIWPTLIFVGTCCDVQSPRIARAFTIVGGASYPIYLLHLVVYNRFQKQLDPLGIYGGMIFLMLIVGLSILVDLFYDIPVRRRLTEKILPKGTGNREKRP